MLMLRLMIFLLSLFSVILAQDGCMDINACNYDASATTDCEGNEGGTADYCCEYADYDDGECDCDGNFFDCSGVCGGDDYSSCMITMLNEVGWYDNEDCSGDFNTTITGECEGVDEDGPPITSEQDCLDLGGVWLTGGCWEESMTSCTEWYDDSNGNGEWDADESFDDNNNDGTWTAGYTQEECEGMNGVFYEDENGCADICVGYTLLPDVTSDEECDDMWDDETSSDVWGYNWVFTGELIDDAEGEFPIFYFYFDETLSMTCDMKCEFESDMSQVECEAAGGEYNLDAECEFDEMPSEAECETAGGDWDDYDDECYIDWDEEGCLSLGGEYVIDEIFCELTEEECSVAGGTWDGGICPAGTWDECGINWADDADIPPFNVDLTFGDDNNCNGFTLYWEEDGACFTLWWVAYESDGITVTEECEDDGDGPPECMLDCPTLDDLGACIETGDFDCACQELIDMSSDPSDCLDDCDEEIEAAIAFCLDCMVSDTVDCCEVFEECGEDDGGDDGGGDPECIEDCAGIDDLDDCFGTGYYTGDYSCLADVCADMDTWGESGSECYSDCDADTLCEVPISVFDAACAACFADGDCGDFSDPSEWICSASDDLNAWAESCEIPAGYMNDYFGCGDLGMDTLVPFEFGISKAYPNPFNPVTEIEFGISEYSEVKLDVLDINGRVVDQIESGSYSPGVYTLSFNGNNHPSGLYFIRLQSSNSTSMHKVMLMK